jgi:hypothetical protein
MEAGRSRLFVRSPLFSESLSVFYGSSQHSGTYAAAISYNSRHDITAVCMTQHVWQSIPPTQIYLFQLPARVHADGPQIVYIVTKSELTRKPYKVKVFFMGK